MASIRDLYPAVWLVLWLPVCVSVYVTDLTGTWDVMQKERKGGVRFTSSSMLRYTLDSSHGLRGPDFHQVTVTFSTKMKQGILFQMTNEANTEYISLEISNNGRLKVILDVGFSREEIHTPFDDYNLDLTTGLQHVAVLRRTNNGRTLFLQADNYPPVIHTFPVLDSADTTLDKPKYLYVGNNDTSKTFYGFEGCIYSVQLDSIFPLQRALQDPQADFITFVPARLTQGTCGLPATSEPPQPIQSRLQGLNVSGQVPGSMYTALLSHHVIQDPYYRDNDVSYRWIGRTDWTYSRTFTLSKQAATRRNVQLVCEGLDTRASIYINDQLVGTASNMFLRYVFDVKDAIQSDSESTIRVEFQSAVEEAVQASDVSYKILPQCPAPVQHGECHVNVIRKEQCSFSWDWGPSFPTQGIWKNIYIHAYDTAVIRDLTALPSKTPDGSWNLEVWVYFDIQSGSVVEGLLTASLDDFNFKIVRNITVIPRRIEAFIFDIPKSQKVEAWWPNGYGNQTLYPLRAEFRSRVGGDVSSRTIRVGFRTVELVQDQVTSDPKQGQTFYFKINNVPIFFKGSNWIPADIFQERITRARLENLFQSAADVHINSMRVWGGGVYESDDFYDLADEYGIMIWQDLMFSVAMYPATPDFLSSVTAEVTYQLRRLKHHPSIVVWAGSNENEAALRQNWFGTSAAYQQYYADFVELYVKTIMPLVTAADSTRPYLTSSPSNGDQTKREGWVAMDPGSQLWGDIHHYDYKVNNWDPSNFPIPRFASEYGVQSWCSLSSLEKVFAPKDMGYWSDMAIHRQHHARGNDEMLDEFQLHFNLPNNTDMKQEFGDIIYLTQINQAMSIRTQTEHYRRWQSRLGSDGRGLTMGALYWQLNDIWQAPTWASLEYSGKWKMLHYYAQHFFQPALVSPYLTKDGMLDVFVVVDEIPVEDYRDPHSGTVGFRPQPGFSRPVHPGHTTQAALAQWSKTAAVLQGSVVLSVFSWSSFSPLKSWTLPYKLNSTADSIFTRNVTELVTEAGCPDVSSCFLHFSSNFSSDTWLPLTPMKNARGLSKAQVRVTQVQQTSPMEFLLTLSSDHVTPFVWLDAGPLPGRFGDNGFLMTSATHSVTFQAWAPTQTSTLQQSLSVLSLMDIYHDAI